MTRFVRDAALEPDRAAFYGIAGTIVDELSPQTEADPVALLIDLLASFGSAVGLRPYTRVDGTVHRARLYVVIAGASSRSRKGTSRSLIRSLMEVADATWASDCERSGLSTGEGLVEALGSSDDPRLLVVEPEFSRVLRVSGRESNTLSEVIRDLWDRDRAAVMTRGSRSKSMADTCQSSRTSPWRNYGSALPISRPPTGSPTAS